MSAAVPLIDLDRPPPAPAESPRLMRSRLWLVLAVVAAALFTLSGAVPARSGVTPVMSVTDAVTSVELGAGSLFVSTPADVRRYDLPTGTRRWTTGFGNDVQNVWVDDAAGIVLVLSAGGARRLTALEAGSGRLLWAEESENTAVISMGGGGVLTQNGLNGVSRLRLTDSRTGRVIWTREVDPGGFLGPDELYEGRSPWIVAVGSTGLVTVLSYADGSVLGGGDLGLSFAPKFDRSVVANSVAVSVVGDRLYLSRRQDGRTSLTAYSVRSMTRLWRSEGGPIGTVTDCGPVLCVADTRFVSGVDRSGGGMRWQQPAWGIAYRYDAGRLFAYDNQEDAEAALLDAVTGRVLRPLGHSRQLGGLVLRTEGLRTWVSVPEAATGDLRTAGSVDRVAWFRCQAGDGYLICPTLTGETAVWRIR